MDRGEFEQGLLEAGVLLWRSGGVITIAQDRVQTDVDGEMVPRAIMFEWKDRTDAKPQPEEAASALVEIPVPEPDVELAPIDTEPATDPDPPASSAVGDDLIERDEDGEPVTDWTALGARA